VKSILVGVLVGQYIFGSVIITRRQAIGLKAPKARNVIAWGNAPGDVLTNRRALKARNETCGLVMRSLVRKLHYALSALHGSTLCSWGVAPGYYISRLWRSKNNRSRNVEPSVLLSKFELLCAVSVSSAGNPLLPVYSPQRHGAHRDSQRKLKSRNGLTITGPS
jgi:hypothetical protein